MAAVWRAQGFTGKRLILLILIFFFVTPFFFHDRIKRAKRLLFLSMRRHNCFVSWCFGRERKDDASCCCCTEQYNLALMFTPQSQVWVTWHTHLFGRDFTERNPIKKEIFGDFLSSSSSTEFYNLKYCIADTFFAAFSNHMEI